jgi:hypothetical protein
LARIYSCDKCGVPLPHGRLTLLGRFTYSSAVAPTPNGLRLDLCYFCYLEHVYRRLDPRGVAGRRSPGSRRPAFPSRNGKG